tara:strand:- start:10177 stop:10452 length:276 start_codon:yes stop_codon:yes gene_type:complete
MDASEMLDVLHYYFDEDFRYGSLEGAQLHSNVRDQIFGVMYGTTYKYGMGKNRTVGSNGEEELAVKPYVQPTEFDPDSEDPFGSVLDAPIS